MDDDERQELLAEEADDWLDERTDDARDRRRHAAARHAPAAAPGRQMWLPLGLHLVPGS